MREVGTRGNSKWGTGNTTAQPHTLTLSIIFLVCPKRMRKRRAW